MVQRKPAAASTDRMKGTRGGNKATDAQRAAGRANLDKGRAKKAKAREQAEREDRETSGERWARLLDGSLTVAELDDAEITKMRVKSKDGTFNGKGRALPSHLAQAFHKEAIKRANDKIRTAAPEAVQALLDIGSDKDVKDSDRVRALMYIIDRGMGKVPETVRIEEKSKWDETLEAALGGGLDRSLADDPRADGDPATDA